MRRIDAEHFSDVSVLQMQEVMFGEVKVRLRERPMPDRVEVVDVIQLVTHKYSLQTASARAELAFRARLGSEVESLTLEPHTVN